MKKDFTKIAFHSNLFKGRSDWYFCYLKTEKIAAVLALLTSRASPSAEESLRHLADLAAKVTEDVTYGAAGEITEEGLLAGLFSILSKLRLSVSEGHLSKETGKVLLDEYEGVIERIVGDSRHLGLSVSPQDLAVPTVVEEPLFASLPYPARPVSIKDIKDNKGHSESKPYKDNESQHKGHQRAAVILDFVQKNKGVSIKDISGVVRDCSEKTIQRELNTMIEQGIVSRQGERRWSTYHPA